MPCRGEAEKPGLLSSNSGPPGQGSSWAGELLGSPPPRAGGWSSGDLMPRRGLSPVILHPDLSLHPHYTPSARYRSEVEQEACKDWSTMAL